MQYLLVRDEDHNFLTTPLPRYPHNIVRPAAARRQLLGDWESVGRHHDVRDPGCPGCYLGLGVLTARMSKRFHGSGCRSRPKKMRC